MRHYKNKDYRGIHWDRPRQSWDQSLVDPAKARQLHIAYTAGREYSRFLTHPSLVEEHFLAGAGDGALNRAGIQNSKVLYLTSCLRVLFMLRIGAPMIRTGLDIRPKSCIEALDSAGINYAQIVDDWFEAERAAGFLVNSVEETNRRAGDPLADLRVKYHNGQEVGLEAAQRVRRPTVPQTTPPVSGLSERLSKLEETVGEIRQVVGKREMLLETIISKLDVQATYMHDTSQTVSRISGQIDEVDADIQDILEGGAKLVGPDLGLVGGVPAPARSEDVVVPVPHKAVPTFKPSVTLGGDIGEAMAFSDQIKGS